MPLGHEAPAAAAVEPEPEVDEEEEITPVPCEGTFKCSVCLGYIKKGLMLVTCPKCGKNSHDSCARRVGACVICGRKLKVYYQAGAPPYAEIEGERSDRLASTPFLALLGLAVIGWGIFKRVRSRKNENA